VQDRGVLGHRGHGGVHIGGDELGHCVLIPHSFYG
jgi:hypothetical protein